MAISVVRPAAGQRIGNGHKVFFTESLAWDASWWIRATITSDVGWPQSIGVQHFVVGDTPSVLLGYGDGADGNPSGVWGPAVFAIMAGVPLDYPVSLFIETFDGAGTHKSSATIDGYFHDPVSGLPYLIRSAVFGLHDPMLDTILERVTVKGY